MKRYLAAAALALTLLGIAAAPASAGYMGGARAPHHGGK